MSARDAILARCDGPLVSPKELLIELEQLQKLRQKLMSSSTTSDGTVHVLTDITVKREEFLQTFVFREMNDREEYIPRAHFRTYEWIFEEPQVQQDDNQTSNPDYSERENLRRESEALLASLGVDLTKNSDILAFRDSANYPTAPLQQWLKAGEGVL